MNIIDKVRKVKEEAADFLQQQYDVDNPAYEFNGCLHLHSLMVWEYTPQGHIYWQNISLQMGGTHG